MACASSSSSPIEISSMRQLAEARDKDDDWTGMTNAAARRKRQGRLNTRAYRMSKRETQRDTQEGRRKALESAGSKKDSNDTGASGVVPCWDEDSQAVIHLPASTAPDPNKKALLSKGNLPPRIFFPLSPDHLITLIQLNVLRACNFNSQLLSGLFHHDPHDCTKGALRIVPSVEDPKEVPPSLAPTQIQSTIPHEHWVDVLPHPRWRNNFIEALGSFDEKELLRDILGDLFDAAGSTASSEKCGMLVWSPPWHHDGWELSKGFVHKWGWTLKGCEEVVQSTNKWRALRGEDPVVIEI